MQLLGNVGDERPAHTSHSDIEHLLQNEQVLQNDVWVGTT